MATTEELQAAAATAAANAGATAATPAASAASATPAAPAAEPAAGAATPASNFNPYDDKARIDEINRMYDSYANSQKAALQSSYNQNLSDLEANRAKIAQQYQNQRNANAVSYERSRRNFNQQASMNGLNTGAFSQAALAQNNQYQGSMAQLGASEATANSDLEKSIADLKVKYEGDVNEAIAKNDYNRAASLLDEYNDAYSRAMTKASQLAQYGDFSGYAAIYGADAAQQMSAAWEIQNPLLAYNLGRISAKKFKRITGKYPPGYKRSSSSSRGGYSYGGSSAPPANPGEGGDGNTGLGDAPSYGDFNATGGGGGGNGGGNGGVSSISNPVRSVVDAIIGAANQQQYGMPGGGGH